MLRGGPETLRGSLEVLGAEIGKTHDLDSESVTETTELFSQQVFPISSYTRMAATSSTLESLITARVLDELLRARFS